MFRLTFLQRAAVAKQRFAKRYRHPELDARLTKTRLAGVRAASVAFVACVKHAPRARGTALTLLAGCTQEARSLLKARKLGVAAPVLYHVDAAAACLYMEFVAGASVKDRLFAGLDDQGALRARSARTRSSPNSPAVPLRRSQRYATWQSKSAVPWRGCTMAGWCTVT